MRQVGSIRVLILPVGAALMNWAEAGGPGEDMKQGDEGARGRGVRRVRRGASSPVKAEVEPKQKQQGRSRSSRAEAEAVGPRQKQ